MKCLVLAVFSLIVLCGAAFGGGDAELDEQEVLDELLAMEVAALDGWYGESDPTLYAEQFADTATYYDPWFGGRIDDGDIKPYLMAFMDQVPELDYEIPNPRLDLYGNTAILTFNEDAITPADGSVTKWNVTLIYVKTDDGWEKVHANWAYADNP